MQSLPDLSQLSHAQKDEIIRLLWAQLQELTPQMNALQERIKQLEGRLSLNSKNSSKPPATAAPANWRCTNTKWLKPAKSLSYPI